ncbi:hypothetical protein Emag_005259 [Eimeria magna]
MNYAEHREAQPLNQVEPPSIVREDQRKEDAVAVQADLVQQQQKSPDAASPAVSAEWQPSLVFQHDTRYLDKHVGRDPHPIHSAFSRDSRAETETRRIKGNGSSSNALSCWLMALMTLNTLVLCMTIWQLRVRASRMMHAQELAIGELADAVKLRLLPCFEQGFQANTLTPSVLDARITQRLYDWTLEKHEVVFAPSVDDASSVFDGPPAYSNSQGPPDLIAGSPEEGAPVDFLLSPAALPATGATLANGFGMRGRSASSASDRTLPSQEEEEGAPPLFGGRMHAVQPTPPDGRLGCAKLSLASKGLRQLLLLCNFEKLLSVDVSDNKLASLYPLRLAANLVLINACKNALTSAAELSANHKLEHVDLSYNSIDTPGDWQYNARLRVLRLRGNRLTSLKDANLKANHLLRELDISQNEITSLEQLPVLRCLDTLDVGYNKLKSLKGLEQLPCLVVLHAEANNLVSLNPLGLGRHSMLREVYVHQNDGLRWPRQLRELKSTEALQSLQLSPGPLATIPHWRLHVVYELPELLQLDGQIITAEERLAAREAFGELIYIHRRVWESLVDDEAFEDRRLLKLEEEILEDKE